MKLIFTASEVEGMIAQALRSDGIGDCFVISNLKQVQHQHGADTFECDIEKPKKLANQFADDIDRLVR